MYSDPVKKLRTHVIKLRLSSEESDLIKAIVGITGGETAPLCRAFVLDGALAALELNDSAEQSDVKEA